MSGLEAARRIMETLPSPIVVVSGSHQPKDLEESFQALDSGVLAVAQMPNGIGRPYHEKTTQELIRTLKLMSKVKLVRRWTRSLHREAASASPEIPDLPQLPGEIDIVAIGASTGSPPVVKTVRASLPGSFPAPILVVQHMSEGFTGPFVDWLNQSSPLPVHVPKNGEQALPGHVYVAPEAFHMSVKPMGRISFSGDGAQELKLMKDKGATAIAQDEASSVIFGIPGEAIRLHAAAYVLSPAKIVAALAVLANVKLGNG